MLGDPLLPSRALDLGDRERGEAELEQLLRIGSNASWRMYATTIFMPSPPWWLSAATTRPRRPGSGPAPYADQLGLRDELLRVAVHAVLGDVEAGVLFLGGDPQAVGLLDHAERRERVTNTNANTTTTPSAWTPSWWNEPRVHQARLADRVVGGQLRVREDAARERAPDAGQAVRGQRADRVVDLLVDRVARRARRSRRRLRRSRPPPTARRSPTEP